MNTSFNKNVIAKAFSIAYQSQEEIERLNNELEAKNLEIERLRYELENEKRKHNKATSMIRDKIFIEKIARTLLFDNIDYIDVSHCSEKAKEDAIKMFDYFLNEFNHKMLH